MRAQASAAAHAGEIVVTLGGDGIAGAAADGLRELPGSVLGIIPAGRGNDLARVLGIPRDPLAACAVIARGAVRQMDIGEVDGRAFVGIASVGFDSDANRIANLAPAWMGSGVYAYGAFRALLRWRPAAFQLELAAESRTPWRRPHRNPNALSSPATASRLRTRAASEAACGSPRRRCSTMPCWTSCRSSKCPASVTPGSFGRSSRAPTSTCPWCAPTAPSRRSSPRTGHSRCTRTATRSASSPCECASCPRRSACSHHPRRSRRSLLARHTDELSERVPLARSDAVVRRQAARSPWAPTAG